MEDSSTSLLIPMWPQMPAGYVFPKSSKLHDGERIAQADLVDIYRYRQLLPAQRAMVIGTLLGDGHLSAHGQYVANHGWPQREYLWTKHTYLSSLVLGQPSRRPKDSRGYVSAGFWTVQTAEFASLRVRFYPDGVKRITSDVLALMNTVDFLSLMGWWVADDGTRSGPMHSPTMMICSHGFTFPEVDTLCQWLTDRGYPSSIYTSKYVGRRPYPMLQFTTAASVKLMRAIMPWTPPCMRFKLKIVGRNDEYVCLFCGRTFIRERLITRTDQPYYPNCDRPDCETMRQQMRYQKWITDPDYLPRKYARSRELLAVNPERRTRVLAYGKQYREANPEVYRKSKQTYNDRKKAERLNIVLTCRRCNKLEKMKTSQSRTDKKFCAACRTERMRIFARIRHWQAQLQKPNLPAERKHQIETELIRLHPLLDVVSSE